MDALTNADRLAIAVMLGEPNRDHRLLAGVKSYRAQTATFVPNDRGKNCHGGVWGDLDMLPLMECRDHVRALAQRADIELRK